MANIGKNIKRLRMEKGVTQEAFAKTINVSRQAVSSWETGRTQPDIEMLGSLSETLGVSIEELIYGERRNIKIDNEEKNYISTATLVISILGGILLFSGAVLILIWCWDHIPLVGKGVFSVLPLASGIAASVYVMMKKREDSFFMETAASAWMVGAILTVICINDFFNIHMGVVNCIFVDAVLILFPMYIMRCVSPLIFYYGLVLYAEASWLFSKWSEYAIFAVCTLFVSAGILLVYINRKKIDLSRLMYARWVSVIAVLIFVWLGATELVWFEPFGVLFSIFALCYAIDKDGELISPYAFFGTIGGSVALFCCAHDVTEYLPWGYYAEDAIVPVVVPLVIFALALRFVFRNSRDNILKIIQIICFGVSSVAMGILSIKNPGLDGDWDAFRAVSTPVTAVVMIAAFTVAIMYVIQGLKENRLFPLNLGFVSIGALTLMILAEYETDMLLKGCVLLIMGGILMFINLKIARVKEKEKKALAEIAEATDSTVQED